MVYEWGSVFSFSLSNKRGLLETGVGSSSTEVEGEAVLVIFAPKTTGVTEVAGIAEGPFLVIRTAFFPIFDNGLSFLNLILAYMSLLNLVIIFARGKTVKKKKKGSALTSLELTLFPFNIKILQDEGEGLRSKTVKSKGPWVHKVVPTLNYACIINSLLHSLLVPTLWLRPPLNCAKRETGESIATTVNKIKLK